MFQRWPLLVINGCDRTTRLFIRLTLLLGVLALLLIPVNSFAGSGEALKAYQSGEYQEALEMWLLQAYEGDSEAQYRLGLMFLHGTGVVVSTEEAIYWLSRAAEQGKPDAQHLLGAIYLSGKGLSSDRDHGLEWWEESIIQHSISLNENEEHRISVESFNDKVQQVADVFEDREGLEGTRIIEQGEDPRGIYFIDWGKI